MDGGGWGGTEGEGCTGKAQFGSGCRPVAMVTILCSSWENTLNGSVETETTQVGVGVCVWRRPELICMPHIFLLQGKEGNP